MGPKASTPAAAHAPVAMIADGDVTARATFGLKKRSRKLSLATGQKLLTTAVNTLSIVFGSVALYDAELVASAIVFSTSASASLPNAIGKIRTGLPVSPCVSR